MYLNSRLYSTYIALYYAGHGFAIQQKKRSTTIKNLNINNLQARAHRQFNNSSKTRLTTQYTII